MKHSKDTEYTPIGGDWYFRGDARCVRLCKRKISDKGKAYYSDEGYYNNLQELALALVDKEINPISGFNEIIKGIDNLKEWIKELKFKSAQQGGKDK